MNALQTRKNEIWIAWVSFVMMANHASGLNSSCEIPSVFMGSNTNLTCFFSEDLSQRSGKIKVIRHNTIEEAVLLCFLSIGKPPNCQVRDNYKLVGNITSTLQLIKLNNYVLQSEHFSCQVIQSAPYSAKRCGLIVKEASTTAHYTSSGVSETTIRKSDYLETGLKCNAENSTCILLYVVVAFVVLIFIIVSLLGLGMLKVYKMYKARTTTQDCSTTSNENRNQNQRPVDERTSTEETLRLTNVSNNETGNGDTRS